MPNTIFYSWQSDLPASENKNFLWDCLMKAVKELNKDSVCVEAERDTKGVSGSPDIAQTIFTKIDQASVFVADISFVNPKGRFWKKGRRMPNPNVMIEMGYAAKTLGWNRVICLFNTDFGTLEELPFDLKFRRVTPYHLRGEKKAEVRKAIVGALKDSIRAIAEAEGLTHTTENQEQVRGILFSVLLHGMEQAWKMHMVMECGLPVGDDYAIITDSHIQMLEEIRGLLSEGQYMLLHDMLYLFKYMYVETADKGSGEFCQDFIGKYLDAVYVEYFEEMRPLSVMQFVKKDVFIVLQELRPVTEREEYVSEKKSEDGETVYRIEGEHSTAYDKQGQLLCDGTGEIRGGFTGWKTEYDFAGQFENGARHGDGVEYYVDYTKSHAAKKKGPKREGKWENGHLVEGTLRGVLMHKGPEGYAYEADRKGNPMLVDDFEAHERIRNFYAEENDDDCRNYYVADMVLKNEEYDIIEGTIRPVCKTRGGVMELYCEKCSAAEPDETEKTE